MEQKHVDWDVGPVISFLYELAIGFDFIYYVTLCYTVIFPSTIQKLSIPTWFKTRKPCLRWVKLLLFNFNCLCLFNCYCLIYNFTIQ